MGDVSKWGRCRALPVADEAKATEWPRSKFLHGSVEKISGTRAGHNGADSKHSRVCHALLFETLLFIGVYATCNCTPQNLHLAVFSQFGNLALPLQFYMETYRSGHNGADSKSVREQSPASSNLAVSAKDNRNLRIAVVFFL